MKKDQAYLRTKSLLKKNKYVIGIMNAYDLYLPEDDKLMYKSLLLAGKIGDKDILEIIEALRRKHSTAYSETIEQVRRELRAKLYPMQDVSTNTLLKSVTVPDDINENLLTIHNPIVDADFQEVDRIE